MTSALRTPEAREQAVEDRMGRCVHFTGLYGPGMKKHETCTAGVRYDTVRMEHEPITYAGRGVECGRTFTASRSLPCVQSLNHCGAVCAQRQTPTRDEAEAYVAKSDREIGAALTAFALVSEASKNSATGSGVVACPKCGASLHWAKAAGNGHLRARCETPDCLAWMQ